MICGLCNQNEASIHFTEIINNEVMKLRLCEECAKTKGVSLPKGFGHFHIANLLAGLSDLTEEMGHPQKGKIPVCPVCGTTFEEVRTSGMLGCASCYEAFSLHLAPLLKRIHPAARHTGKYPKRLSPALDENMLRRELQEAISREEFEKAAKIRDRLRTIKP